MQQIIHRPPDQAAGEPPEQPTRSPEQQIRLTSQLRTLRELREQERTLPDAVEQVQVG